MSHLLDNADRKVARIAAVQHGVVSTVQLSTAGIDKYGVRRRVRAGLLHRLHRGVYAVGHPGISREGRWMAATLACGRGAVVSHRSAAALWRLLPPADGPLDVSVVGTNGRLQRLGIRVHRKVSLLEEHMTRRLGIPVTRPARTIADLRGVVRAAELRRALREASALGLRLDDDAQPDGTASELEYELLMLCDRYGIPRPEVNVRCGRHIVDFLWREQRVVVETDGYRFHSGRQAFEDDHQRDLDLGDLGFEVLRVTYRMVMDEPSRVAGALKRKLALPVGD